LLEHSFGHDTPQQQEYSYFLFTFKASAT